ncbi:MAG: hypothetical protein JXA82_09870 [Sedimentisphaerales bacterium]|nr:hypothetical protein [Sedimentisphaerales bacterium]
MVLPTNTTRQVKQVRTDRTGKATCDCCAFGRSDLCPWACDPFEADYTPYIPTSYDSHDQSQRVVRTKTMVCEGYGNLVEYGMDRPTVRMRQPVTAGQAHV